MRVDLDGIGPLRIDVEAEGPDTAMHVAGELDLVSRQPFWSEFSRLAERPRGQLIIDLSEVSFLDASGLRTLVDAEKLVGRRLVLRAPSAPARRILELTGLDGRFLLQFTSRKVDYVRRLWAAFALGGAEAMARLVPEDVEWVPFSGSGQVLRGTREMSNFWAGRSSPARALNFTQVGGDVVVEIEAAPDAGELWAVYHFDGDRLTRAVTFTERAQALDFAV